MWSDPAKRRVLILGMCALPMGTMERQLGNMAILIPTLKLFSKRLPDTEIRTSLQLSPEFEQQWGITSLDIGAFYNPTLWAGIVTMIDFLRATIWAIIHKVFRLDVSCLVGNRKLTEIREADVVLDFSGDTFGDMAHPLHLLKQAFELGTVLLMGKPLVFFAQSPGPFSTWYRRLIARLILGHASAICAREPYAFAEMKKRFCPSVPVIGTACPAFLLEPNVQQATQILKLEGFQDSSRLRLGVTITGFSFSKNLVGQDKYRIEREHAELMPLVRTLQRAITVLDVDVLFIPHVFRFSESGELIHGPDTAITGQLQDLVIDSLPSGIGERVRMIQGCYDAQITKGIIASCDCYLSGRLHASVAALSQGIPTVLLAYGRKFFGFASLVGQQDSVSPALAGAIDEEDLWQKLQAAVNNRDKVREEIYTHLSAVQRLAELNIDVVADLLKLEPKERCDPPRELVERWESVTSAAYPEIPSQKVTVKPVRLQAIKKEIR